MNCDNDCSYDHDNDHKDCDDDSNDDHDNDQGNRDNHRNRNGDNDQNDDRKRIHRIFDGGIIATIIRMTITMKFMMIAFMIVAKRVLFPGDDYDRTINNCRREKCDSIIPKRSNEWTVLLCKKIAVTAFATIFFVCSSFVLPNTAAIDAANAMISTGLPTSVSFMEKD